MFLHAFKMFLELKSIMDLSLWTIAIVRKWRDKRAGNAGYKVRVCEGSSAGNDEPAKFFVKLDVTSVRVMKVNGCELQLQ